MADKQPTKARENTLKQRRAKARAGPNMNRPSKQVAKLTNNVKKLPLDKLKLAQPNNSSSSRRTILKLVEKLHKSIIILDFHPSKIPELPQFQAPPKVAGLMEMKRKTKLNC